MNSSSLDRLRKLRKLTSGTLSPTTNTHTVSPHYDVRMNLSIPAKVDFWFNEIGKEIFERGIGETPKEIVIVDYGCGNGMWSKYLLSRIDAEIERAHNVFIYNVEQRPWASIGYMDVEAEAQYFFVPGDTRMMFVRPGSLEKYLKKGHTTILNLCSVLHEVDVDEDTFTYDQIRWLRSRAEYTIVYDWYPDEYRDEKFFGTAEFFSSILDNKEIEPFYEEYVKHHWGILGTDTLLRDAVHFLLHLLWKDSPQAELEEDYFFNVLQSSLDSYWDLYIEDVIILDMPEAHSSVVSFVQQYLPDITVRKWTAVYGPV